MPWLSTVWTIICQQKSPRCLLIGKAAPGSLWGHVHASKSSCKHIFKQLQAVLTSATLSMLKEDNLPLKRPSVLLERLRMSARMGSVVLGPTAHSDFGASSALRAKMAISAAPWDEQPMHCWMRGHAAGLTNFLLAVICRHPQTQPAAC